MPDDAVGSITTNEPRHIQFFNRSVGLRQLASHPRLTLLKLFQLSLSFNVNFMTSERFFEHTFRLILRNHDAGTKGTFSSRKIDLRQTLLLKPILSLPNGYTRIDEILSWHSGVEHFKATRPNNQCLRMNTASRVFIDNAKIDTLTKQLSSHRQSHRASTANQNWNLRHDSSLSSLRVF